MTLFNVLSKNFLRISRYKNKIPEISIPFRLDLRNVSSRKFYFNKDKTNNKNFHNLAYGISGSIGIAVLLGVCNNNLKPDLEKYIQLEKIKSKLSVNAVTAPSSPRTTFNFLADVVEKTEKSVVYIEIIARHPLTKKSFPVSNGSGFIVRADGLILTNAHVVNHYGHVIVKLYDGREFRGIVENVDTETDLATVRIEANNLPELPLGRSSDLRPGEFVIAMGNPLTLSHTITAGVVSSANRQGQELGLRKQADYIQTDAAINVGNSGGPLVNLDGEAIGINTMKVTEGISFAIPSDRATEFLAKTEQNVKLSSWNPFKKTVEKKKNKFLGITMLTLSPAIIKDLKERNSDFPSIDHGVFIWRVMIGSPSYECGIRPGDIISEINGSKVYSSETIQTYLEKEDVLHLTVKRGQKTFEISVPLVETVLP